MHLHTLNDAVFSQQPLKNDELVNFIFRKRQAFEVKPIFGIGRSDALFHVHDCSVCLHVSSRAAVTGLAKLECPRFSWHR